MTTFRINITELNEHTMALIQLLKTDKSIEVIEEETVISESQIAETRRRITQINSGDITTRNWDEAKKEIFD